MLERKCEEKLEEESKRKAPGSPASVFG